LFVGGLQANNIVMDDNGIIRQYPMIPILPQSPIIPPFAAPFAAPAPAPIPFHPIPLPPIVPAVIRLGRYVIADRAVPPAEEEDDGTDYDSDEDDDGEDSETDEEVERYHEGGDDDYDYDADREGYESS